MNYIFFDDNDGFDPANQADDAGWKLVPGEAFMNKIQMTLDIPVIKKPGLLYIYLSYENESSNPVFFDDLKVTYNKSQVVQSNNYYAFGGSTQDSWTRFDTKPNQYLYNAGSELNGQTGNYETFFRGYDPVLGRFHQVDPMASKFGGLSPYNYALNNPVYWNDPTGADVTWDDLFRIIDRLWDEAPMDGGASWSAGGGFTGGYGYDAAISYGNAYNAMFSGGGGGGSIEPVYGYKTVQTYSSFSTQTWRGYRERYIIGFNHVADKTSSTWEPFFKDDLIEYAEKEGKCTNCKPYQLGNAFEEIFENLVREDPNAGKANFRRNLDRIFSHSDRNTKPDFTANAYYVTPTPNGSKIPALKGQLKTVPEGTWYEAKAMYGALYASSSEGQLKGHIDNLYQHTLSFRQNNPGFVPGLYVVTTADVRLSKSITAYAGNRVNVIHVTLQFMVTNGQYQFRFGR